VDNLSNSDLPGTKHCVTGWHIAMIDETFNLMVKRLKSSGKVEQLVML
jgi:hypothetical protein